MAGSEVLPEGLNVVNEKLYALSPILVPLCSNVAECNGAFEIASTHELSLAKEIAESSSSGSRRISPPSYIMCCLII